MTRAEEGRATPDMTRATPFLSMQVSHSRRALLLLEHS